MPSIEAPLPFGFAFAYDFMPAWWIDAGWLRFRLYREAAVLRVGPHRAMLFLPHQSG